MKLLKINLGLLLCLSTLLVSTSSCNKDCVEGIGTVTTETLAVSDFTAVDLSISTNVTIQQGSAYLVEATGHPNIIEMLKTEVSNGVWEIDLEGNCYRDFELDIEVTMPIIESIRVSGSGSVSYGEFDTAEELNISISGSGSVTSNGSYSDVKKMDVEISGSGGFTGMADYPDLEELNINVSGSGEYNAFPISTDDCTINVSGSGGASVTVNNNLDATISGSGDVNYKGNLSITSNISGSGKLVDAN